MEKKKTGSFYSYVIIGSMGMLLLAIGLLEYISLVGSTSTTGFLFTFVGFIFLVHCIYYLEKQSGMSNGSILVQSAVLASALLIFTYIFY